jgi:hypothetical protein
MPASRGRPPGTRLGAVGGIVVSPLLATGMVAVALGLAAVEPAILAVILRGLWGDLNGRKR